VAFSKEMKLNILKKADNSYQVEVYSDNSKALNSPKEGHWSIATEWKNSWPANWIHSNPTEKEKIGRNVILKGKLETTQGLFEITDSFITQNDIIKCVRRFEWTGEDTLKYCTLSIRFQCPGKGNKIMMPGILYYGNPSGSKSGNVPVYNGNVGDVVLFEEHRFPMPYVSIEWQLDKSINGAALHSLPTPVPYSNLTDQWWSLGTIANENGTEILLLSGPCAMNGKKSVVKAFQSGKNMLAPYDNTYLNIPPGAIIEKTFFLEAYPVEKEGSGFQQPTHTSLQLFSPFSVEEFPTFQEIIQSKYQYAKTRWYEDKNVAGFKKYYNRDYFVFGWCGQTASPGYGLQVLTDEIAEENAIEMVTKSLDFLSTANFYDKGFYTWYDFKKKEWKKRGNPELLSQGQAMLNFANAIRVGQKSGLDVSKWKTFLQKACEFHAGRILDKGWNPKSTNEAFFIAPLCAGSNLLNSPKYKNAAIKAGEVYASRHLSMREPYWGGTLDARCEDKEGAFAALQGFLALYELTGEQKYLEWAEHACDVVLTYVVVWDIDMPPGRLRDHNFKTRGWTAVSVQNMHIDVYGVLIAPEVYRLGKFMKNENLKKVAILMFLSCGQLIDVYGSQGEQPQHTNYTQRPSQRGNSSVLPTIRGDYVEDWTVFWITAHFLNAAAQFKEMGVDVSL